MKALKWSMFGALILSVLIVLTTCLSKPEVLVMDDTEGVVAILDAIYPAGSVIDNDLPNAEYERAITKMEYIRYEVKEINVGGTVQPLKDLALEFCDEMITSTEYAENGNFDKATIHMERATAAVEMMTEFVQEFGY